MSEARQETPADAWGQPISEERQAKLQDHLDRWAAETNHGERKGPFDGGPRGLGASLTGADVFWLAERVRDTDGRVPALHLMGANLASVDLPQSVLVEGYRGSTFFSDRRTAHPSYAQLQGAYLSEVHFERARTSSWRTCKALTFAVPTWRALFLPSPTWKALTFAVPI